LFTGPNTTTSLCVGGAEREERNGSEGEIKGLKDVWIK
jgi:hypothetical protein